MTLVLSFLSACSDDSSVKDIVPPVIELTGEQSITVYLGEQYIELGATATDNIDGNLAVVVSGEVDTSELGVYVLTYSATDNSGNTSSIERTVFVVIPPDNEAPVISLNGSDMIQLLIGESYAEQGASAIDNVDGEVEVVVSGEVNTDEAGTYNIHYSATDTAGNVSTLVRTVLVEVPRPFITTWDTTKAGVSGNNQIKIDTNGEGYHYAISWGDGSVDENVEGDITHTYDSPGIYTIEISGTFPQLYMAQASVFEDVVTGELIEDYESDNQKLIAIEQWGTNRWQSMHSAFRSTTLEINATDKPYLINVTDMSFMFACDSNLIGCVFNQEIGDWDVSHVKNMSGLFSCPLFDEQCGFNQDISDWDVANVEDMSGMFYRNVSFDQAIGNWDVSNVTNMSSMFFQSRFNQDISAWNVSNVTEMINMFYGATKFNQAVGNWDVSSVVSMAGMFYDATEFNQELRNWNVSNVVSMSNMFRCRLSQQNCAFNQDINDWDLTRATDLRGMFSSSASAKVSFDQNISSWNIVNVKQMAGMFEGSKLSTVNYDALLLGWSTLLLQQNVTFDAGNSQYSEQASAARQHLIQQYEWTVLDQGLTN